VAFWNRELLKTMFKDVPTAVKTLDTTWIGDLALLEDLVAAGKLAVSDVATFVNSKLQADFWAMLLDSAYSPDFSAQILSALSTSRAASIVGSRYLPADKAASILNSSYISASAAGSILAQAQVSNDKAASILSSQNLSSSKTIDILKSLGDANFAKYISVVSLMKPLDKVVALPYVAVDSSKFAVNDYAKAIDGDSRTYAYISDLTPATSSGYIFPIVLIGFSSPKSISLYYKIRMYNYLWNCFAVKVQYTTDWSSWTDVDTAGVCQQSGGDTTKENTVSLSNVLGVRAALTGGSNGANTGTAYVYELKVM